MGSNLGDRSRQLSDAIELLRRTGGLHVTAISQNYEYSAVGGPPDSPLFLNAAIEIETALGPRELLDRLLEIERQLGRHRREKWGPRIIDLDLILYGDQIIDQPGLTVPHPIMHERQFVLQPLAEIAAEVLHPALGQTIVELLRSLRESRSCDPE